MLENRLMRNFKLQFPNVAVNTMSYENYNDTELIAYLEDGSIILYDDLNGTIRNLPQDSSDMTEGEFLFDFSIRLRKMIDVRGIPQNELAQQAGISPLTLSRYVNGRTTPNLYIADRIAKALDCSLDELRYV
jgi:DNA-binding XRE family transcriptional regulator